MIKKLSILNFKIANHINKNTMRTTAMFCLSIMMMIGSISFASNPETTRLQGEQAGEWEKLGSRVVDMKADHDVIMVTAKEGAFTKVRLRIMKAPIHLLNINIVFRNGDNKNVVFNKKFAAGSFTRVIDLPGNKRIIKSVKLNYKSIPAGKGRSVITLFGKH